MSEARSERGGSGGRSAPGQRSAIWRIRTITEDDAYDFASWRYDGPYSLYDPGPETAAHYLDPGNGYLAVVDEDDALVAHCCFGFDARVPGATYDDDATDIGVAMRPALTGRGLGSTLLGAVTIEAERRWPGRPLRATIATFNERAQRLVRTAGFHEVEIFTSPAQREFVVYLRR